MLNKSKYSLLLLIFLCTPNSYAADKGIGETAGALATAIIKSIQSNPRVISAFVTGALMHKLSIYLCTNEPSINKEIPKPDDVSEGEFIKAKKAYEKMIDETENISRKMKAYREQFRRCRIENLRLINNKAKNEGRFDAPQDNCATVLLAKQEALLIGLKEIAEIEKEHKFNPDKFPESNTPDSVPTIDIKSNN